MEKLHRRWEILAVVIDRYINLCKHLEYLWHKYEKRSAHSQSTRKEIEKLENELELRNDEISIFRGGHRYGVDPDTWEVRDPPELPGDHSESDADDEASSGSHAGSRFQNSRFPTPEDGGNEGHGNEFPALEHVAGRQASASTQTAAPQPPSPPITPDSGDEGDSEGDGPLRRTVGGLRL